MRKPALPALTGIRFYAALLVYLSHVPIIPGGEHLAGDRLIFNAGVVGVSFFFVLSGFILTYNYADVFRDGIRATDFRRFVWDRLTKIYPVHLLALALVMPVALFSPNLPLDWRALPIHILLLQCFWPSHLRDYLNVPSWSISCEWFFYLLGPVAIFSTFGRVRRGIALTLTAVYICVILLLLRGQSDHIKIEFVSWFAPSRFLEFLVGVFLAHFFMAKGTLRFARAARLGQAAGIALIVFGAICRQNAPWPFWGGALYVPGSALLIISLAYGRTMLAAHLTWPWINRLGVASFSFYLIHAPVLRLVKGIFLRLNWQINSWTGFGATAIGLLVLIQAVSLLVCSTYELPLQKYFRRFGNHPNFPRTIPPAIDLSSTRLTSH